MKRFTGLAVQGTMLALASPAAAQSFASEDGEYRSLPSLPPESGGSASRSAFTLAAIPSEPPGELAGPPGAHVIGSLPVMENADLNIGLFSVPDLTAGEISRRRTDLSREMKPPRSRVAAVGFSMRF